MEPVPYGMKLLAIALLRLLARDLKRGKDIHPKAWSSELQVCKNLSRPSISLPQDSFCWLLNPFFAVRLWRLGWGFFEPWLGENHVFQVKIRSRASQAVIYTHPKWESKGHVQCYQMAGTVSPTWFVSICTGPQENSSFSEPAGEENNALNQANTNLLFPRCDGAHSCGLAARLRCSCVPGCRERRSRDSSAAASAGSQVFANAEMPTSVTASPPRGVMEGASRSFLFLSLPSPQK